MYFCISDKQHGFFAYLSEITDFMDLFWKKKFTLLGLLIRLSDCLIFRVTKNHMPGWQYHPGF